MKRRLAFLLALSLTFASLPVTGAGAAETAAATETEVVTEIAQEEASDEGVSVETEAVDLTEEDKNEAAAGEQKQEETVSEENAAAAETTDEIAAEVEPEVITDEKDAKQEASVKNGWVNEGSSRYYYSEGKALTYWKKIDGVWYYFNASGVMQTGWQKINNRWYYLNDNGSMQIGWKDLNHRYYFDEYGAMVTGWQKIDGSWYLFGPGGAMLTGWQKVNNRWYYLNDDGSMQIGWKDLNHRYYFDWGGSMVTGWQKIDGIWYSFGPGGAMQTDWQKINGKWYYLSTDEEQLGQMVIGWKEINGRKYYFDPSGAMATGWRQDGDDWYYMGPGGAMMTGWVYDKDSGGGWFYLNEDGKMRYGWFSYKDSMYYLDPTLGGAMVTYPKKCEKIDGGGYEYYFFNTDGTLGTGKGWKKNGPYWYYTHEDGSLYRNTTITENGRSYKLDEYGRWGDAMDAKAQGYSSSTNYLILVDKSTFKVRVYKGSRNNWTRIKDWDCTHGGSDTPNGVFTIDDHVTKRDATYGWADFDYSSAAYACHISAGNYFHSILFDKGTRGNPYNQGSRILDDELRTTYSHGCIRLTLDNAKWVWDNIPFGTKVVVYNS